MRPLPHFLSWPLTRPLTRPVSRRAVQGLLAGAAVAPLAGCDLLPEPTTPTPPPPSADERLVDQTVAAIRAARDVAVGAPRGQALVGVHDAHLAALGAPASSTATTPTAPTTPSPTSPTSPTSPPSSAPPPAPPAGDLRTTELGLEATLADAAARADDGGLARLLASMAASLAQHTTALGREEPPR